MNSANYSVGMKFSGHTKVVDFSFFEYTDGVDCRCRMIWSDNFIEFWLHQRGGRWRFRNRLILPRGIAEEEVSFEKIITILIKKHKP